MKVELYLALIATFYGLCTRWNFKSILFIIATSSWISSLLINISPFYDLMDIMFYQILLIVRIYNHGHLPWQSGL